MNRAAEPSMRAAATPAWAERNQRWLATRFAAWRLRIDGPDAAAGDEAPFDTDSGDGFVPAALQLSALFGLSGFETELLCLAAGMELDRPLREAVLRAQGPADARTARLPYALALAVLPQAHWDALSPLGPLRRWSLLQVDASEPLAQAGLRVDERILHQLTGSAAFDERLLGLAEFDECAEVVDADGLARIVQALTGQPSPLLMLANAQHDAAHQRAGRALAAAALRQVGLRCLWVDAGALVGDAREQVDVARRIDREAALSCAGVVFELDAEAPNGAAIVRAARAMRCPLVVLGSLSPMQLAGLPRRQCLRFNLPTPQAAPAPAWSPLVQRCAQAALQQFHVEPALLEQVAASVAGLTQESEVEAALWAGLRASARGGLDALAQRIDSQAGFDDLVVPPFVAEQLREITSQLRHRQQVHEDWGFGERHSRGLGIAALFAGESGTGKTLAAEVIAHEARLDLYRIDLSSVVSKYIGETEKNLSRLFDAAERSGAVLLFDEADALFGKRSEVKDSHDRYANIEVAYLLQRIESYRGLAILTSNLKSALDRAFLRRIRFVVQFPMPDEAAREQIWRRQFPARAPLGDVDFAKLARLQLSGGNIRSVALNAAFRAAGRGVAIGQALVVDAARAEFLKLERNFTPPAGGTP